MPTKSSRHLLVLAGLALFASACAGEYDRTIQTGSTSYELSPDQRYIVTFANANGRGVLEAASHSIALDLPSINGAAAYLPDTAVAGLANNPNIALIEPDVRKYPMAEANNYGYAQVQADLVPDTPAAGRITVCVIDSGLSAAHEDFAGVPVTGTSDSSAGAWNNDTCGHGTHVAGSIAAVTGNGIGVKGVAPEAVNLHIVKVFDGPACGWSYSSSLITALDKCQQNGASVVSMSLGGGSSQTENTAFQNAYNAGVLSIAAAGNAGNSTNSYPASYDSVVSVAAIDSAKVKADFSQYNSQVELSGPGVGVTSTYPYRNSIASANDSYNGNQIEFAASGSATGDIVDGGLCDSVGSWSGKTVVCQRGNIAFNDKVQNAQAGGAVAAVIYNNAPGNFNGTLGTGNTSNIPAISLSDTDGAALLADGGSATTDSGVFADGYADLSGTSMATPHVSAVAALVWAHFPSSTNDDIRSALAATAEDLGAAGRDNEYGYGLVQAKAAYDYLANPPLCTPDGNTCDSANDTCCDGSSCQSSGKGPNKTWACAPDGGGGTCTPSGGSCRKDNECCAGSVCTGSGPNKSCS